MGPHFADRTQIDQEEVMAFNSKWWISILSLSLAAVAVAAAGPGYHVIKTYKLGGEGGWDYLTVDASARHFYISRGTHVIVLDADSGKNVGDIPDTPGVHGIALAPELGKGFVSNGREGTVTVFDIKTLAPVGSKIKVGENPDAILYEPATKRVFTFNGHSQDSTAIDAASGKVLGTIKLDGKPEFAASDAKGEVFVNIEDKSELTVTAKFGPPPAATADNPHPRRTILPDTFEVLVLSK